MVGRVAKTINPALFVKTLKGYGITSPVSTAFGFPSWCPNINLLGPYQFEIFSRKSKDITAHFTHTFLVYKWNANEYQIKN